MHYSLRDEIKQIGTIVILDRDEKSLSELDSPGLTSSLGIGTKTIDGKIMGTPDFMSPEQIQEKDLDQRSNMYSTGVLVYQLFTWKASFMSESFGQILLKHMHEHLLPSNKINPQIPAVTVKIVLKSTEKEPTKCY